MTPSPVRKANTPSTPPASKSLLSKISSPFGSKPRNFADFEIVLDDPIPHKQYSPGETVRGVVVLKVLKPIRVSHITISLYGYAQVYKNPNTPGEGFRNYSNSLGPGRRKATGYLGNGFACLFEEEKALCGEGRLAEGVYHFKFALTFPSKGLPSSIDFERGTVTYTLLSTMTRPTTMSPTTTCERKVYLLETVDVAPFFEPKPRVISLEPISRRARAKSAMSKREGASSVATETATSGALSVNTNRGTSEGSGEHEDLETPGSPAPSDISFDTQFSSGGASAGETAPFSIRTGQSGKPNTSKASVTGKTITSTIELTKSGFLRGDNIHVKIHVDHSKPVRSLQGVILTLYRQARVDMFPALPVASKDGKTKPEDYYPKSKTGLGGLSLSSAGSSHVFRKDLSQSVASLLVDPRTLTADVKAAVRVPSEAFPTISSVPGAMISFKYYVEVVIDLQGKLSSSKWLQNQGVMSAPSTYAGMPHMSQVNDTSGPLQTSWSGAFIDTEQLRREKSVVACIFEVVIGTKDSERKGKQKASVEKRPPPINTSDSRPVTNEARAVNGNGVDTTYDPAYDYDYHGEVDQRDYYYDQNGQQQWNDYQGYDEHATTAYPPPDIAAQEAQLPEKERLRRAEERLLPSAPPVEEDNAGSATTARMHAPSAPVLPQDTYPHNARSDAGEIAGPSAPPAHDLVSSTTNGHNAATDPHDVPAPDYRHHSFAEGSNFRGAGEDKQELERRRLQMERSAPDEGSETDGAETANENAEGTAASAPSAPSAPALDDLDDSDGYTAHDLAGQTRYDLPRYER